MIEIRGIKKIYRMGTQSMEALRGISLSDRTRESSSPSWVPRAPGNPR